MKAPNTLIDFVQKEWLLFISGIGFLVTSFYTKHIPIYSIKELQVLFILFVLFVTATGLRNSGLLLKIAVNIERGRFIPLKLIMATFFLSMFITNDIALIVVVPITLSLNINRKDILIIFEALAANAGSALSPIGNPQNLFIYWFYNVPLPDFLQSILPFALFFLIILGVSALFIKTENNIDQYSSAQPVTKNGYIFSILLLLVILAVMHLIPIYFCSIVIVLSLLFDKKSFLIDYPLLISVFFFFGFADNIRLLLDVKMQHTQHIFILSALASQIMSNVPATLLFAGLTDNWKALLWGSNAGGFGSLFGSLANLIAYKLYITNNKPEKNGTFLIKFLFIGYIFFLLSILLYFRQNHS